MPWTLNAPAGIHALRRGKTHSVKNLATFLISESGQGQKSRVTLKLHQSYRITFVCWNSPFSAPLFRDAPAVRQPVSTLLLLQSNDEQSRYNGNCKYITKIVFQAKNQSSPRYFSPLASSPVRRSASFLLVSACRLGPPADGSTCLTKAKHHLSQPLMQLASR